MKFVIITGASSGIGKVLYDEYKKLPDHVVCGVSRRGPDVCVDFKVSDWDHVRVCIGDFYTERCLLDSWHCDLLINCAGILPFPEGRGYDIFSVNFWAASQMIDMLLCDNMCVINIASVSGMQPEPDFPLYAASKAALLSLTGSLAKKYAHRGIRVNSISPGFYPTDLVPGDTPQELIDTIPMKREGDLYQLFKVVRMIKQSDYMTGTNIVIDGGLLCRTN